MSFRLTILVAVIATIIAAVASSTEPTAPSNPTSRGDTNLPPGNMPPGANAAKATERLRENTKLIDVIGTFQSAGGDSISFARDGGKDSFRVLENLALQRVSQNLEDNRGGAQKWVVSGTVTEFRGANFLLVTKAVQLQEANSAAK